MCAKNRTTTQPSINMGNNTIIYVNTHTHTRTYTKPGVTQWDANVHRPATTAGNEVLCFPLKRERTGKRYVLHVPTHKQRSAEQEASGEGNLCYYIYDIKQRPETLGWLVGGHTCTSRTPDPFQGLAPLSLFGAVKHSQAHSKMKIRFNDRYHLLMSRHSECVFSHLIRRHTPSCAVVLC